ncbi:LysR family transcriptional regulator [Haliea sp. E17]|uniref:LysR family transcriptional regulator n=1 Tax=Haliea sp. E17 TaxID=3401576 RepID=UPI003AAFBA0C
MNTHRTTLEQWRMFQAVVEHGGFAQAAEAIHKSQSSINHAVHKLEALLGLQLLEVVGRKAQLTKAGALMLRRAEQLLSQAGQLEAVAGSLATGVEAEVRVAVDEVYPNCPLADALQALSEAYPNTRVQLHETVLSGGAELLTAGAVDLLISGQTPPGFLGEPLMRVEFIAVARPDHSLFALQRELTLQDLEQQRQVVVRDSARHTSVDSGWLGAEQRWTVSHITTSVEMVERGMGFAWLPGSRIGAALAAGRLQELPLGAQSRRYAELYLIYADRDRAGPATCRLGELFAAACAKRR